jgi:hypothetical protein
MSSNFLSARSSSFILIKYYMRWASLIKGGVLKYQLNDYIHDHLLLT